MKQKLRYWKPLSIVITTIAIFIFTVLIHHLSIELGGNNFIDAMGTFKLTKELPTAVAQTPSPLPPTPSPTPSPTLSTQSIKNETKKTEEKTKIQESTVLQLLLVVLIGVLFLLFTLLSPVVGSLNNSSLDDKANFLTQTFPKLLEGVTVVLIVMVIAVLTLAGYLQEQGTISILSALVGYVLGKKSAEEADKTPRQNNPSTPTQAPTSLSVKPTAANVKFDGELKISVMPAQDVDVDIPQNAGSILRKDKSTIVYKAPPQVSGSTTATITVRSKEPSLQPVTITINLIP